MITLNSLSSFIRSSRRLMRPSFALVFLALTAMAASANKLVIINQPGTAIVGEAINPPLEIAVLDANGNTVTTSTDIIMLILKTNPGGGTLSGTTVKNTTNGVATFNDLSIDKAGKGYTIYAISIGPSPVESTAFDVTTGLPSKLAFTMQPSNTFAGEVIVPEVMVTVQDEFGYKVATASVAVTLSLGNNPSSGMLSGDVTVEAVDGVAAFDDLSIGQIGTGYTLVAAADGLLPGTSAPFDIKNNLPVASDGTLTVLPGIAHTGKLVAVDSDDASLTYAIVSDPGKGTVNITDAATGAFKYTANSGETGTDSFTFKATDTHFADSNIATVTITIAQPMSAITLAGSPVSPLIINTNVALTAAVTGGLAPEYQFWVRNPGSAAKTLLRDYAADNTCAWTPATAGTYTLLVYAREQGYAIPYKVYQAVGYTVNQPLCAVKLSGSPLSPVKTDTAVTLTAAPTGGAAVEYKFLQLTSPAPSVLRDFNTAKTFAWTPTEAGTYSLQVIAREKGTTTEFSSQTLTYTVKPPLTGLTLTGSSPTPTAAGTKNKLIATAIGGVSPEYQFWVKEPGAAAKKLLRDYAAGNTCTWTPAVVGTNTLIVYVREKRSAAAYQFYQVLTYVVKEPLTGVALAGSPPSPTATNTLITFTATATGGGTPEYQFWVRIPGSEAKTILQDYSTVNTCTLLTTVTGEYTVLLYVREKGSSATYQFYQVLSYTVYQPSSTISPTTNP